MTTKNKRDTTNSEPKNQPKKQRFDSGKKKFGAGAVGKKFVKGQEKRKGYLGKNFRGKDGKIDNSKLQQPPPPLEKPNWVEIKAKKKTQKVDRKKEKFTAEVYELGLQAKQIYEKLKRYKFRNATIMCMKRRFILFFFLSANEQQTRKSFQKNCTKFCVTKILTPN
jgi:hypothetical protein